IYSDGKRIKTIDIDSTGFWSYLLKLKDGANKNLKLKFFDQYGTLINTEKAKVQIDTEDPAFITFPPDNKAVYLNYQREENRTLIFQAKDNQKIDKYKIEFNGKINTKKVNKNSQDKIQSFLVPKDTPKGIYPFKATAYDEAGNKVSQEVSVNAR
ncbi:MAG: hypothetical protein V1804_03570, partial [Patescibacteria group bacterium]